MFTLPIQNKRTANNPLCLKEGPDILHPLKGTRNQNLLPKSTWNLSSLRETADPHGLLRRAAEFLHLPKASLDVPNLPKPNWKRPPLTKQMVILPVQNMRAVKNPLCPRHSSSAKRDQKPKPTPQENMEPFISIEGGMGSTPTHEENLRHFTSPHVTSNHTTSTSTRTRLRYAPYTQEAIKTSPAAQEC
ncbi:hypothetical protein A6R68_13599 [Neotoma lepida]|uniref:Uncharacterized protein n=1 Tax=Neotoma lepida TaxID=56216 RepID=A0A1A6H0C2_NEOLE|nr:hypothetical protein A6R68_13599 [Neotoma lepida]